MAKHTNILNAPKEREEAIEEFPELEELGAFFKHLWNIIQTTEHSDEHTSKALSEQKRYENTLKALFGSNYSTIRSAPDGFTYDDMRQIMLRKNETNNLEGSIKEFLKAQQTPIETTDTREKDDLEYERDEEFEKNFNNIKQHLHQARHMYEGQDFEDGKGFPWN